MSTQQESRIISESELILSPDGRVYHLKLRPEELADTIILVGDPERVDKVSQYFDRIDFKQNAREFVTHTGYLKNKRLTVMSTGMSTANSDIVLTELDALVNVDLDTRQIKQEKKSLTLIRLGTSGSLQSEIALDSLLISTHGLGLDNLLHFYRDESTREEQDLLERIYASVGRENWMTVPYFVAGSSTLIDALSMGCHLGITLTAPGFYGPQNRNVRMQPKIKTLLEGLSQFTWKNHCISNFEMETAGIYGMSRLLGHEACSVSAIVADRVTGKFSRDPYKTIDRMIQVMLERIITLPSVI